MSVPATDDSAPENSSVRYRADYLIPLTGAPEVISNGVVDVTAGRVSWSGPAELAPPHDGKVEMLEGVMMPGFVNTHAHSPMVLFRGAGEGLTIDRWLTEVIWPREGRLTPEDVWWGMSLGASELLSHGITTSHETYFFSETLTEAAIGAGLRGVITPPILTGKSLARFGSWEKQLDEISAFAGRYSAHSLITAGLGPHSAYGVPEEALRGAVEMAKEGELHIHIHVAEGRDEDAGIRQRYGMTVPRYLDSIGMLDLPVVMAHGVWLTDDDIALLATRSVGVAHCPESNGKLASGIAPVSEMRAAGIPVAIATDGPSSNDRLDPFQEMRTALRFARLRTGDASALGPADVLVMATREAATVLHRPDLGHLGAGARADMVLVNTSTLGPIVEPPDLITHVVNSGSPELVEAVWVGGRQVVERGRCSTVDVEACRRQVSERARRLAED